MSTQDFTVIQDGQPSVVAIDCKGPMIQTTLPAITAHFPQTFVEIPCGHDSHGNPYVRRLKVDNLTITQRVGLWLLGWKVTARTTP